MSTIKDILQDASCERDGIITMMWFIAAEVAWGKLDTKERLSLLFGLVLHSKVPLLEEKSFREFSVLAGGTFEELGKDIARCLSANVSCEKFKSSLFFTNELEL